MQGDGLTEFRCACGRLLARVSPRLRGTVQVKCKGCHAVREVRGDGAAALTPQLAGDAAECVKAALHSR